MERGEYKKILMIVIIVIIALSISFTLNKFEYEKNKRLDVKIPVLLYHNFVNTVPDKDPDNFSYINTPQSFGKILKLFSKMDIQ